MWERRIGNSEKKEKNVAAIFFVKKKKMIEMMKKYEFSKRNKEKRVLKPFLLKKN